MNRFSRGAQPTSTGNQPSTEGCGKERKPWFIVLPPASCSCPVVLAQLTARKQGSTWMWSQPTVREKGGERDARKILAYGLQNEWVRNRWMNDTPNFILIHIKVVCHSKLHQLNCNEHKAAFDATHTLCRYTLAENHCYTLRPVTSFWSPYMITSVSYFNKQQLPLAYGIISRLFAWRTMTIVIWPHSFSGLIPSCPEQPCHYSPSAFGERTTPSPLCYHAFADVSSSGNGVFTLISFPSYIPLLWATWCFSLRTPWVWHLWCFLCHPLPLCMISLFMNTLLDSEEIQGREPYTPPPSFGLS